ncbi:Hypothetical protein Minf_1058 [Methylacidiphilum infernorum V4]|uniref:Uncharacterized protein n=1 Tax=Methylacidiphilum infernorum (isolate V4) TaxID=481448 RepID=B3DUW0_METI4|nr:Hypothetical protein Minf_1058 [Methylacidiphilum infernorum V4]
MFWEDVLVGGRCKAKGRLIPLRIGTAKEKNCNKNVTCTDLQNLL